MAYTATCTNPNTGAVATSQVDTLEEAQVRARTLRVDQPLEDRASCVLSIIGPGGVVWKLEANKKARPTHAWKKGKK